jgi:glucose/arabinose dehydrogenase
MRNMTFALLAGLSVLGLIGCGDKANLPEAAGTGPDPKLPPPKESFFPTVNISPAWGWPKGVTPTPAAGLAVTAFATGLDHPRWLYTLPNGDVLVAETNAPPSEGQRNVSQMITDIVLKIVGAGVASPNRITLLRDADRDGVAETKSVFLEGLNSPFGMALVGRHLYVADTDALFRFPYHDGDTKVDAPGVKVTDLPAGPINLHWTKNVIASVDGTQLFVTVGSNSNVGEKGFDDEKDRAAILAVDPKSGASRLYASGLRNPNGLAFEARSGALWTTVNERDMLGSDLVPDYMTHVEKGGFYGWPYSYFGQHLDPRIKPQRPELVAKAIVPDYALGAHTASLGLAFYESDLLPAHYRGGAFIGQHGSWNRTPKSGYKVIFVPFADGKPSGPPEDILTGFIGRSAWRGDGPSALPSTAPAACWWRMMSATSFGASAQRLRVSARKLYRKLVTYLPLDALPELMRSPCVGASA